MFDKIIEYDYDKVNPETLMQNLKKIILLLGDILFFYIALFSALILRYGIPDYLSYLGEHLSSFVYILIVWLLMLAASNTYDFRTLKNDLRFFRTFLVADLTTIMVALALFYAFPLGIAPKTNLVFFAVTLTVWGLLYRYAFNAIVVRSAPQRVFILGESKEITDLVSYLEANPQLGYRIAVWERRTLGESGWHELPERIAAERATMLVIPADLKKDPRVNDIVYLCILREIQVRDIPSFYEEIMGMTPLAELGTGWFLEELVEARPLYSTSKTLFDVVLAFLLFIVLLPVMIVIWIFIRLDSHGPAIFKQVRVGKNGKRFTLYKFRTMYMDAEQEGAQWAEVNDPRATRIGSLLRISHLDEFPQLVNILKGNISFVGPRPERPEFVEVLKTKIPYYEIRLVVKPGLTGWAQINYRANVTEGEAYRKLEYDIFYIRRRGFVFDFLIILKTLKTIFATPK